MRRAGLLAISMMLTLGGCQCEDVRGASPWELGVVEDGGVDTDIVETDTDQPPETDVPEPDVCDEAPEFQISYFELGMDQFQAPRVTRGTVYSQTNLREIVTVDSSDGSTDTVAEEGENRLRAAAGGKALVYRRAEFDEPFTPVIVDSDGSEEVIGDFSERLDRPRGVSWAGTGNPFDGSRFGVVLENDPNAAPGWIGYYDGSTSDEIHVGEWTRPPVSLTPDGLVFAGRTGPLSGGGNREIFIYDPASAMGLRRLTNTQPYERNPTTAGSLVYWNTDRAVYRMSVDDRSPEVIHDGFCGPVDADGRRATFICDSGGAPGDSPSSRGPRLGDELRYYDGERVRRVPTGRDYVTSPRVDGRSVVWFAYDNPTPFSGTRNTGELRYWRVGMAESVAIDEVGAPCLSCGAIWPPINLSADGGVIAWNYAVGDEDRPTGSGGGVATWVGGCE